MKKIPDMDAELALFEEELRKTDEQLVIQMETKLENQDEKNEKKVEEHKQEVGELGLFGEEEEDRQRNTFLEIAKRKKLFKKMEKLKAKRMALPTAKKISNQKPKAKKVVKCFQEDEILD